MSRPADETDAPAAWMFEVDPRQVDLADAFAGDEAVIEFEVDEELVDVLAPGQVAHLWVHDPRGGGVPSGVYATGSIVGPVVWAEEDGERYPVVEVGLDPLAEPIDGIVLLAGDEFVGSALQRGASGNPVALDSRQAASIAAHPLTPGPLSPVLSTIVDEAGPAEDDGVVLPALEVRLPADTLLVVEGPGHEGWTVVRGTPEEGDFEELPERHRTFMDAVEYVASVADQAAGELPVVDLDDGIEAIAIFDAVGGVFVVVKEEPGSYSFCWLEDDGTLERVDAYATLKEAILLPVLDQELFGDR